MNTEQLRAYLVQQKNLRAFCRETGLSYSTMHKFMSGYSSDLKGVTKMALMTVIFQRREKK